MTSMEWVDGKFPYIALDRKRVIILLGLDSDKYLVPFFRARLDAGKEGGIYGRSLGSGSGDSTLWVYAC